MGRKAYNKHVTGHVTAVVVSVAIKSLWSRYVNLFINERVELS